MKPKGHSIRVSPILLMVVLGVALRFVQESRADAAAAKLKAMISVTTAVVRDGETKEIQLTQLVPGDIVTLSAGDMIPADVRLILSKGLFVAQAALTGESLPVEKLDCRQSGPMDHESICVSLALTGLNACIWVQTPG
jgi:Mg2+-importing ATPase